MCLEMNRLMWPDLRDANNLASVLEVTLRGSFQSAAVLGVIAPQRLSTSCAVTDKGRLEIVSYPHVSACAPPLLSLYYDPAREPTTRI